MTFQEYNAHIAAACKAGTPIDMMLVLAAYRSAMFTPAATKFGTNPYRRDYRDLRDRLMRRATLPDRKPRTALEAGLMVLERAQTMGGAA